jgi:hypothetical protein
VQGICLSSESLVDFQPASMDISRPSLGTAQNEPSTAASGTSSVNTSPALSVVATPRLMISENPSLNTITRSVLSSNSLAFFSAQGAGETKAMPTKATVSSGQRWRSTGASEVLGQGE